MLSKFHPTAAALCLTACAASGPQAADLWQLTEARTSSIEPTLSETVRPGDDFYLYANETWLVETEVPADRGSLSELNTVAIRARQRAADIIEEAASDQHPQGTSLQRIGDLYRSYMDEEAAEKLGLAPLREGIDAALAVQSHEDVARFMGRIRSHTIAELDVFPDAKNPGVNGIELSQHTDVMTEGVVGLSNPDVYRGDTSEARERLAAYRAYITETLAKAGIDRPAERASAIIALETKLAEHMWRPEKLRDREANYHKMSYAELQDYAAGFPWEELYRARGLPIGRDLVLGTDTAVKTSARIFAETSVDDWSSYLAYHWIDNHWSLLPAEFSGPGFEFHIAEPYGVEARTSLAERAAGFVEKHLGREVGRVYVEQYFSERDRARAEMMVGYIREAFREKIEGADWMDESTRQQALRKLANVRVNIGYPRKWRDYSGVRIEPDQRIGNHARLLEADWERRAGLLGKPFPDGEWVWGYAYHVDAAITPQLNTITFPAAIIERSMGRGVDPAAAFGEIGIIIGHEMGHAFDDQGASFDSTGRIRDWWSPGTRAAFEKQTRRIAEQYSQFEALPGLNLSGERAQGEAIADLIGYSVALRGYELFAEDHYPGGQAPVIDGLSWRERFFLASAQGQRTVWTDEALRQQVENGYHPPGEMRVNGSVRNIGAWYETFDVKPFDDLYIKPEQRVSLW